jgi:hypothetical protein
MDMIFNLIIWIKNNIIKFIFIDTILLIVNICFFNIVHNGIQMNLDIILTFIVTYIFLCVIYFIIIFWIFVTNKYSFLFLHFCDSDSIRKIITLFFINIFIILNIVFIVLIWIYEPFIERGGLQLYFGMPWTIIICIKIYNNDIKKNI